MFNLLSVKAFVVFIFSFPKVTLFPPKGEEGKEKGRECSESTKEIIQKNGIIPEQ